MKQFNKIGPVIVMGIAGALATTLMSIGAMANPGTGFKSRVLNPMNVIAATLICEATEQGVAKKQEYILKFNGLDKSGVGAVEVQIPFRAANGTMFLQGQYKKSKITEQTRLNGYDNLQIHAQSGPSRVGVHKVSMNLVGIAI